MQKIVLATNNQGKVSELQTLLADAGFAVVAQNTFNVPDVEETGLSFIENAILKARHTAKVTQLPKEKRTAYFYCALAFMQHENDPTPIICLGKWNGLILNQPHGNGGFGYDPLFYIPELDCSAAELTKEHKSQISHRGQALKQLIAKIKTDY